MEILKIILLSIIQGISEILPISSSGHLILFKHLIRLKSEGLTLEIFLHIGSLIAVIIYYKNELKTIICDSIFFIFNKNRLKTYNNFKLFLCLIISTFITGLAALFLNSFIEKNLTSISYLPFFFLITSIILFFTNFHKNKVGLSKISYLDAFKVGLIQIIGLIPGISRSGSTLFGLKFTNLDTESSFKYSYLLFIPITFCSFLLEIIKLITNEINLSYPLYYYFLGITISLITTFASIKLLSLIIKKDKLYIFSYYLLILSLFCIILLK